MTEGKELKQKPLELISAAVHDIKTPLVFIRGAASELNLNDPTPQELSRQLSRIEQSASRLLNLVDSLIGSAQASQQELALEPAQAEQAVRHAIEDIQPYAEELGFSFNTKFSQHLPPVLTNSQALSRVLFNLLDNAVKYTQNKKQIDVTARRDGDRVKISVRDYGIGVRPEDVSQIWKLFGQAAEPASSLPGTSGLGLYIASTLSRSLSAEIDVKPLAQGTRFFLRLPVAHQLSLF